MALTSIISNRIFAVGVGLWLRVPALLMLTLLILLDIVQIPFFYRLYEQGSTLMQRMPSFARKLFDRDWSVTTMGRWASPLGGLGVMMVAAFPTLGGGMWSATFLAYGLGLRRRVGYIWMITGSLLSYLILYWILETIVLAVRYFGGL